MVPFLKGIAGRGSGVVKGEMASRAIEGIHKGKTPCCGKEFCVLRSFIVCPKCPIAFLRGWNGDAA